MTAATIKNITGIIQFVVAIGIQFIPVQYQGLAASIIAALAGVHAVTAGTTGK